MASNRIYAVEMPHVVLYFTLLITIFLMGHFHKKHAYIPGLSLHFQKKRRIQNIVLIPL